MSQKYIDNHFLSVYDLKEFLVNAIDCHNCNNIFVKKDGEFIGKISSVGIHFDQNDNPTMNKLILTIK